MKETTAAAMKRLIAWQLTQAMKQQGITKTEMAARMRTSRKTVRRLLDASDTGVTLAALVRASAAMGMPLRIELAPLCNQDEPITFTSSSGNVFTDLGFPPDEAAAMVTEATCQIERKKAKRARQSDA